MKKSSLCLALLGLSVGLVFGSASYANNNSSLTIAQNSAESFNVVGTEPFWNVKINRNGIVYSSPQVRERKYPYSVPLKAQGRPSDLVRVYQLRGQQSGTLILRKVSSCSDGMSDKVYPYNATLMFGNQVFDGCAEKK